MGRSLHLLCPQAEEWSPSASVTVKTGITSGRDVRRPLFDDDEFDPMQAVLFTPRLLNHVHQGSKIHPSEDQLQRTILLL